LNSWKFIAFCIVCILFLSGQQACGLLGDTVALPDQISYNYHVRPILSDKCFVCHGPDKNQLKAGLRLDMPEAAYAPLTDTKGAYAIVPGNPEASEVVKRIKSQDTAYVMPVPESHLGRLTEYEIAVIEKWIAQGAKYEKHWAFIAPIKTELPSVKKKDWPKSEIDHFTLAKMEGNGLKPNQEANQSLLLKRLSLDLTGLPPTEAEMDAFESDKSPEGYEKTVDRLLASPHFGEKMAIYWLDIARYADSYGYQDDNIRTQWPYRDWVMHAFNQNMPYDQFITWQLAGDLLPNAGKEQVLATAFLRNHKYTEEGGVIPEEYRVEYIDDKVKTYTKGMLALTVECAKCHDHKYDPIAQTDYYKLFGFFNSTKEQGYEGDVSQSKPAKAPWLTLTKLEIDTQVPFVHHKDTSAVMVSVMGDLDTIRPTYVLDRGVYDKRTVEVKPTALQTVLPFDTTTLPRNRFGLAKWTVDKANPLTARVFVNHLWQELFGAGLVKSTGDFGMQGTLPSHPELLDWLAVDFMEHNWDIKYLVKKMVMTATYRQSSEITDDHHRIDPDNTFLARSARTRIKAELIRDMLLASSQLLVKEIGGPSVKPYQPKGLWEGATSGRGALRTYQQDTDSALYRRGLYNFIKLTNPPPAMIMFDASNRDGCEVKRSMTNTPLQALVMMNDPTVLEASRVFAERLMKSGMSVNDQLLRAFRAIICRRPTQKEMSVLRAYYAQELQVFQSGEADAVKTLRVGEWPQSKEIDQNQTAALMKVVNTIYNMEEAITKS
jgi:hypothetical protein